MSQRSLTESSLHKVMAEFPGNFYWFDKTGTILGCNDQQAISLGLKNGAELIGLNLYEYVDKNFTPEVLKFLKESNATIFSTGQTITFEEQVSIEDKEIVYLSKKAPLRDNKNVIIGIIGISFDITQQKEAERIRVEKAIIEEKLKISKIQAASIAHELRTPLGVVTFMGSVAEDILPEVMRGYRLAVDAGIIKKPVGEDSLKALGEIPHDLQHIAAGANTFIDMLLMKVNFENKNARTEELKEFMIGPVISEAIKMYPLNSAFTQENIEFNTQNDFVVKAEAIFIRHIIFNLLKNAIHHILKARKGKISLWMEPGKKFNTLHFKDTGSGMSEETVRHIFDPFFSNTHHGTGVGLALCEMFMEEFGGKIICDSIEGKYTHFKMQFPKI